MTLLRVVASGTNYEVGWTHGTQAGSRIKQAINLYADYFQEMAGMNWVTVKDVSQEYADWIAIEHSDLFDEMLGVARGANLDVLDIVALNVRSEIAHTCRGAPIDGCTSFSWNVDGNQWCGQNWDWKASATDTLILLEIESYAPTGRPAIKMITEAGVIGKIGLNEHGVCTMLNALRVSGVLGTPSAESDPPLLKTSHQTSRQIPTHLLLRRILESVSVKEALEYVAKKANSRSASASHILMADASNAASLEIYPLGSSVERSTAGFLHHTNHLLRINEPTERLLWADSLTRIERIRELTAAATLSGSYPTPAKYRRILSDRSDGATSICRSEGEGGIDTVFSIAVDCGAKRAEVMLGKPDEGGQVYILHF